MKAALLLPLLAALLASSARGIELGKILWEFPAGSPIFASPTVGTDGTLYLGTNDATFFALSPTSSAATVKWKFTANDWIDASAAVGPDGTVYVGSYESTLYALNPSTGLKKWEFLVGGDNGLVGLILSSPAIAADGTIVVANTAGMIYCVGQDGSQLWSFEVEDEVRGSPVIDRAGHIYFGTHGGLFYSLTADGKQRWVYAVDDAGQSASRIRSSAAIDRDGHLYFGSGNGFLYSLTAAGVLRWKFATLEAVDVSPAIGPDNRVYFASRSGGFFCLSQTGQQLWSKFYGDVFYSSPVLDSQGFLYLAYFLGNNRTKIVCMSPDGQEAWGTQINAVIDSSPTLSPDGMLYVGAFDGKVYALAAGHGLDYTAPWPRFRKDLRSRGRALDGTVPQVTSAARPLLLPSGGLADLTLSTTNTADSVAWRRNGQATTSGPALRLLGQESDVAIYDAIVSNDFGEMLAPSSFLAIAEEPRVQVSASDRRLLMSYLAPAQRTWEVTSSEDLLGWSTTGVDLQKEELSATTQRLKASVAGGMQRFFRLELAK